MSGAHWKTCDDTLLGLEADFDPLCIYCNIPMETLTSTILKFPTDLSNIDKHDGHAVDVIVVCPSCGWTETFGVAIDKEHHRRLIDVRNKMLEEVSGKTERKH